MDSCMTEPEGRGLLRAVRREYCCHSSGYGGDYLRDRAVMLETLITRELSIGTGEGPNALLEAGLLVVFIL
jgi:hypothetical protein